MKKLKDLQVDDTVLVDSTWHRRLSTIQRVTKTQIIVDNIKFNRESGWQCGRDRWNTSNLNVPTEEQIAEIKEMEYRNKLIFAISSFSFKSLPTDKLEQVYNIIRSE